MQTKEALDRRIPIKVVLKQFEKDLLPYWRVKNLKVKRQEKQSRKQSKEIPTEENPEEEKIEDTEPEPEYFAEDDGLFPGIEIYADKERN